MNDLSIKISAILQRHITKGKYIDAIMGRDGLDARGAFGKAQTDKILITLCSYVEQLEDRVKELEENALRPTSKK